MSKHSFVVNGPKFTNFLFNAGVTVVDNVIYRLLIAQPVPEIFAVKAKTCPKLRRISDVFCLPKFYGGGAPQKLYKCYYPEATPLSSKVLVACTLHFCLFYSFVKKIVGETPSPVGCALASPK